MSSTTESIPAMKLVPSTNAKPKRRRNRKKKVSSAVDEQLPPPTQTVEQKTEEKSAAEKFRERKARLSDMRTGIAHRKQIEAQRQAAATSGSKPKNAIRDIARSSIRELLEKLKIKDTKLENDIMNRVTAGVLTTPQQIAEYVIHRLEQMYPQGGVLPQQQQPAQPQSQPQTQPQTQPQQQQPSSSIQSGRRAMKHPTKDLIFKLPTMKQTSPDPVPTVQSTDPEATGAVKADESAGADKTVGADGAVKAEGSDGVVDPVQLSPVNNASNTESVLDKQSPISL